MSPGAEPPLVVSGVTKRYGRTTVLDGVDLTVEPGEIVALTGAIRSGAVPGYCPQEASLFELLTADEHLVMFGRAAGLARRAALERGRALLDEFAFTAGRDISTRNLSGGTRQKLNLAIALLPDPPLLLLDEPYQGFDRGTYVNFWDHCRVWQRQGKSIVVVTHMLAELGRADRVVELPAHAMTTRRHA